MTLIEEQAAEIERLEAERDALREENAQLQAQREKDKRLNHETESGLLEENVRLREENAQLREALKPFILETRPENNVYGYVIVFVKPEQLSAARDAIREEKGEKNDNNNATG